jgi:hypothetical protein
MYMYLFAYVKHRTTIFARSKTPKYMLVSLSLSRTHHTRTCVPVSISAQGLDVKLTCVLHHAPLLNEFSKVRSLLTCLTSCVCVCVCVRARAYSFSIGM